MSILRQFVEEVKTEYQKEMARYQAMQNPQPLPPPQPVVQPTLTYEEWLKMEEMKTDTTTKPKKRTKKAGAKSDTTDDVTGTTPARREAGKIEMLGANASRKSKPHHIVSSLNAASARNAIIMAEVLGKPVSRRRNKGWI